MASDIGGQAVIEGVLMRSQSNYVISVRKETGRIVSMHEKIPRRNKFLRMPFVRGIVNLAEMLVLGLKALTWSANQAGDEDEQLSFREIVYVLLTSFVFAIIFFVAVPLYLAKLIVADASVWFNLIDGIFRVLVFVLYVFSISLMKDIRVVFQYHGAEHKAVNCYEAGKKLTLDNVKGYTTIHPRCGTAFLAIVLMVSILMFSFITAETFIVKFGMRILLIPIIASLSYELLRLSSRFRDNSLLKMLIFPGLLIQKITTREPDHRQLLVAIHSIKSLLRLEKNKV